MPKKNPSLLKMLRLLLWLLIPVLLLLIGSFLYSYSRAMEQAAERVHSLVEYQMEETDASFDQINTYMVDLLMTDTNVETIRTASPEDIDYYRAARLLINEISTTQSCINSGYSFYFYTPRLDLMARSSGVTESYDTEYKVARVLQEDIDAGLYVGNHTQWQYYDVDGTGYLVQVTVYDGMYLACWIRSDYILAFLQEAIQSEDGFYALVDASSVPLTNAEQMERLGVQVSGDRVSCGSRRYDCTYVSTAHMAVGVVVVDRQVLDMQDAGIYVLFVFAVFLIVVIFSLYVLHYFRHYIQEPLEFFQNHINAYLQERKFSKRYGFAELDEVENAFSALETQVRELKIDVYEEKIRRTKTELEYLQNQIKPHFFVNCFSIIYGMAERRQFDRIQEFCLILSDYVRYLLTGSFKKVPLQRELNQIGEFLKIQNIRFHSENILDQDVDEELLDCLIPPVSLLTFVENTVKHNKLGKDDLCVTVSAEEVTVDDQPRMRMRVADNGIGLSTEALAHSREMLVQLRKAVLDGGEDPDVGKDGAHIGLANVYRRLLLLYGDRADMDIHSEAGVGTVVTLTIPVERE